MPKVYIVMTARDILDIVGTEEVIDHLTEYHPDYSAFPENVDVESIAFCGSQTVGNCVEFEFDCTEEVEDEDEDEADQKNDEARDEPADLGEDKDHPKA